MKNHSKSLPELFALTNHPDVEIYIEPQGFAHSAAEGSRYTDLLNFTYETPWRVVLMVYFEADDAECSIYSRQMNGLYVLERKAYNVTPDEMFEAHTKFVSQLAHHAMRASEQAEFDLEHRVRLTIHRQNQNHAHH